MKKNILIALLSFIIGNLFGGYDFCDRTILVTLEPEYSHYTGALEASFFGSFEKDSVENIFQIHNEAAINALNSRSPGQFRSIYLITLPRNDKAKVLEAIDELNTIEGIQSAKPNYITTPTLIPNDEYWHYTSLWNLHGTHGIKAPEAWNVSTGSHNVRVGVIDTGISSHPDLNANVDTQSGWNFAENNDSWIDTHGHGTKTAGILGAVGNNHIGIVGVNWNVTMVPMKIVFGSNGQSHEDHMVKAVEWATNLWGTENEIPILTMSYSGYGFILDLQTAISNFPGLFIWSAGNHGSNLDNFSKIHDFSSLPNLIAVGAIDMNGNRSVWGKESSAYSATNQHVHIYAPGSLGFSTSVNNTYSGYSGTSMAAPHVAGVAALLLSVNPTLSASSLKNIVLDSADNIQISIHNNPNHTVRRLNAHSAILSVVEITVYDIEAESISGPLEVIFNDTLEFTVSVVNTGSAAIYSHEYTTHLMRGGLTIASSHGVDLAPGKSHDFVFNWTPSTYGFYQLNGHVNYSLDQVPSNNTTSNMSVTVQTDFLAISTQGPYNIPNAIRLIAPGGRLELAGGWYNYPDKLSLKNKDFHLIGTGDESYPTTLTAWFEIENVTSEAKIENIIFTPNWNKHFESILRLTNASPVLSNLTFNLNEHPNTRAIHISFGDLGVDNEIEIIDSTFNGSQGIYFDGCSTNVSSLKVSNSIFRNNYAKPYYLSLGNAILFYGNHLLLSENRFIQDTSVYQSEGNNTRQTHIVYVNTQNHHVSTHATIDISNNHFHTETTNVEFYAHDIGMELNDSYEVDISRNIFRTTRKWSSVQPTTRIMIYYDPFSPINLDNTIRIINNTDIFAANAANGGIIDYSFLSHNVGLIAKNNIFTGRLSSTLASAVNHIYNSLFIYNNNPFPINNNTIAVDILYGDPQFDNDLRPLWTTDTKSLLLNAGHRDTNGNGIFWWSDPEDRDPDNTRPDIGAVHYPHSITRHWLFPPIFAFKEQDFIIQPRSESIYEWLAFPFLDKMYDPPNFPNAQAEYVFGIHNDNNLFGQNAQNEDFLESISWNYNDDQGTIQRENGNWTNLEHILDSRYGYKLALKYNGHRTVLLTSGFYYQSVGNPQEPIVIQPGENGAPREILLGYFNIPVEPLVALQDIVGYLTEIKTKYWTYSRPDTNPNTEWTTPDRPVEFKFGEAVSLTFVSDTPKTLIWKTLNNIPIDDFDIAKYSYNHRGIPPQPEHFIDYIEQEDYIPFFVWLPDELVSYDDDSELALYIDDVQYGSTVIYGQLVQIRAYVIGIDLDNAVIEFRYYQHGQRSGEQLFSEYQVYDQATSSYQNNRIDFSENRKFYQVSLVNENKEDVEIPQITSLDGNFPNPFNPFTTIAYSLAESGNVRLQIFNIRGQLVRTLVDEVQNAGRYSVDWHGDSDRQVLVGSGVYFYRLETSAGRQVKRMVLLK